MRIILSTTVATSRTAGLVPRLSGRGGGIREGGHAEVDGSSPAGSFTEPVFGTGEADTKAFDLAEPDFAFGHGEPDQVVEDLLQTGTWSTAGILIMIWLPR
ncbi:hypothetical protein ACWDRB_43565 [Nonomuraea sp. NPDC003707]